MFFKMLNREVKNRYLVLSPPKYIILIIISQYHSRSVDSVYGHGAPARRESSTPGHNMNAYNNNTNRRNRRRLRWFTVIFGIK